MSASFVPSPSGPSVLSAQITLFPQMDDTTDRKVRLRTGTETGLETSLKMHSVLEYLLSKTTKALAPVQWTSAIQMRMWLSDENVAYR